jgi:hypothetical protein
MSAEQQGPFVITSQNTDNLSWFQGQSNTINWSVNNTNTLPGSANVNIRLLLMGSYFPCYWQVTPNDGSEAIVVPNVTAKNCRILIEPVGNIYYVVNSTAFAIGYSESQSALLIHLQLLLLFQNKLPIRLELLLFRLL